MMEKSVSNPPPLQKLEVAKISLKLLLGFTRLDHETNSDIGEKLKLTNIYEIKRYKKKSFEENGKRPLSTMAFCHWLKGWQDLG
jgi:hypothetical protein